MKQYILPIITLSIIVTNTITFFEELKDLHQGIRQDELDEQVLDQIMQQPGALHQAIRDNNVYLVTRLLKNGYNVNQQNDAGNTPLDVAINRDNIHLIRLLLEHGADPNIQDNSGRTALNKAIVYGTIPEIVRLLLEHKATNPNIQDNSDRTALHSAVHGKQPEIVRLLLKHKATNPNIQDNNGRTALHYIAFVREPEIVRLLLEHKETNPNIQDNSGRTALHDMVFAHQSEIVRLLLEHKADPEIKDKEGKTPLDYAIERKHKEIQDLIQQYKMKRNAIIKDSLSSRLPSLPMNLIGEYMGDENPLQKRLLSAINIGNIDEVNAVLSHNVEITGDILKAAQDRIIYLKTVPAFQSPSDITNAFNIFELLESKNPLQQQLLKAINTNNLSEVQNALSQGALITTNILKAAQDRIEYLKKPETAQSSRDMENALQVLNLLKHPIR